MLSYISRPLKSRKKDRLGPIYKLTRARGVSINSTDLDREFSASGSTIAEQRRIFGVGGGLYPLLG